MARLADVNLGMIRQTYRELTGLLGPLCARAGSESLAARRTTRGDSWRGLIASSEDDTDRQ